jgi:peptidylprolyl isomerase
MAVSAGCAGAVVPGGLQKASGQLPRNEVSGRPGHPPKVRIRTPLAIEETHSRTVVAGTGGPLYLDRVFVLQLTMYDGRTGAKAVSTYDDDQTPLAVTDSASTLFPVLTKALVGLHQGSRLVMAATAADTFGDAGAPQYGIEPGDPVVLVADVIAVPPQQVLSGPSGTSAASRDDLPRVLAGPDGTPRGVAFEAQGAQVPTPDHLVVVPLVDGDGPRVPARGLVTLDYLGQVWGSPGQFANTWLKEPETVPLGVDGVLPAWDEALVGVRRGSRLLVVAPPDLAYGPTGNPPEIPGDATLVYVIDVLGVS